MPAPLQIIGYASLLSPDSARCTAPSLFDFRRVTVPGFRRVFGKVSARWYREPHDPSDLRIASCAVRPAAGIDLSCTAFSVSEADFARLFEREHHYRWITVPVREADGTETTGQICAEWTDAEYRRERCGNEAEYRRRVGRFYDGPLWRNDILPYPPYLGECLRAARALGPDVHRNFLGTSFLADGTTTIGDYLRQDPPRP